MSGVVLDVPALPAQPSFARLLWSVLLGYVAASITLVVLWMPLYALGMMPRPFARPGPFPVEGAWSLDADLVVTAVVVLVAAWWIRRLIADEVPQPVSFGVVATAVALTGYAPFLALRPAALSGVIALPATTWLIRRHAIGTTLPFPRPSRRAWIVAVLVGAVVFGSYQVYHPLVVEGGGGGSVGLWNPGWADVTILHVDGGYFASDPWSKHRELPYIVHARSHFTVWSSGGSCGPRLVQITYAVLGRTSTQSFTTLPHPCRRP